MSIQAYQNAAKKTEGPRQTEYRAFAAATRGLMDAASLSMPVFVYAVDGDSALAASLLRARQRSHRWPSGVILDGNPEAFCAMMK